MESNTNGCVMGATLMEMGVVCCHSKLLIHGLVVKYPKYGNQLYYLLQGVKKWKHDLFCNETNHPY